MKWENSLYSLVIHDSPDSEGFIDSATFAGDYRAAEYLYALFVAFFDSAPHIHDVADFKMRDVLFEAFILNSIQYFRFHWFSFYPYL